MKEISIQRNIKQLRGFLSSQGHKATKQRHAIVEAFARLEDQKSIEEIFKIVRKKVSTIGFVTVYRTIKLFEQNGLARKSYLGDGLRYEPLIPEHKNIYLICSKCKHSDKIDPVYVEDFFRTVSYKNKFQSHSIDIKIHGLCSFCGTSFH
ncbi:MAG: transcriptional repressor [Deltaproteobacteria bacterium]|nr:transcriptional repressor [Deltaproteobacteria bacterium]